MTKTVFKTPEQARASSREKYHKNKAERGGAFLAEQRAYKKAWRAKGNDKGRHRKRVKPLRPRLCIGARRRAKRLGQPSTLKASDLVWPTHCPILGIELDYHTPKGQRKSHSPNYPSLDRWDNSKGYEAGNVFVISLRANQLKANATADELEAVARYARHGIPLAL